MNGDTSVEIFLVGWGPGVPEFFL